MEHYIVQFVSILEVETEAADDLQAEKRAFEQLSQDQQGTIIALKVMEPTDIPGALREDPIDSWGFAKERFSAIDPEWVN